MNIKPRPHKFNQNKPARGSRPSGRQSLPEGLFVVEGVAALREYLRHRPKSIRGIYVKEKQLSAVRQELSGFDVKLVTVKEDLAEATEGASSLPGTPVWAHVHHEMTSAQNFEASLTESPKSPRSVLVLDHISDPRNLGAIVRTAAFFGVKHVVVPERRQVLLTQTAVNTAQGGFALCDLVVVVNVARTLEQLKLVDFWVLGAAMDGEPLDRVRGKFPRQAIVLGSEDKGISQNVLNKCDVKVSIQGAALSLDSLNVSVAAGIVLQRLIVLP
ncbi:MAG: RNA methyltransferase [Proteobacteria bacterium]|nr:RNA methyltransferase [Pseudomonadota bacterium]